MHNLDMEKHLFHEGTNYKSYLFMGSHKIKARGSECVRFIVWAPRAQNVFVIGDFNSWNECSNPMERIPESGLWVAYIDGIKDFDNYKFLIYTHSGEKRYKVDPYAFHAELRPNTASKFYELEGFNWHDREWIKAQKKKDHRLNPMNIYEVNLFSWKRHDDQSPLSYRELAEDLVPYAKRMGYTHIELMPIMEHPYDGSWGYQITGYYAPTSRYGTPKDFMYFVDSCHRAGIGVILDWVPVHFCRDDHGLARYDGTYLYESLDALKANNGSWGTLNFDYTKPEVQSFLISNAMYWLDKYHVDGLRIDAVAYMLYQGFGTDRRIEGDNKNYDAIRFLQKLNKAVYEFFPHCFTIAEESTAYPLVTYPIHDGGLGFGFKWNMGWMHDILEYMELDPIERKHHHEALTFTITYCFSENYVLPFSHDEVVHGKRSLVDKMPGTYEQKFANLRLLLAYQMAHPGKKLNFMGNDFGQFIEWNEWKSLDWHLLAYPMHEKLNLFVAELNKIYLKESALYTQDDSYSGFEWIEHDNRDESVIAFERIGRNGEHIVCAFNFTPVMRKDYPIAVCEEGKYKTVINTDHKKYGGETPRVKTYKTRKMEHRGREQVIDVCLPPLGAVFLKLNRD